jgi:hypothetical protein
MYVTTLAFAYIRAICVCMYVFVASLSIEHPLQRCSVMHSQLLVCALHLSRMHSL